jgi:hypothetical protein
MVLFATPEAEGGKICVNPPVCLCDGNFRPETVISDPKEWLKEILLFQF